MITFFSASKFLCQPMLSDNPDLHVMSAYEECLHVTCTYMYKYFSGAWLNVFPNIIIEQTSIKYIENSF